MMMSSWTPLLAQRTTMYPSSEQHAADAPYWFAESASAFAPTVDRVFYVIFWVSAVFFLIIVAAMVYLCIKYRRRPGVAPEPSPSHNTPLELFWSIIPSILLVWFFYEGAIGYFDMRIPPNDAEEIHVVAKKWNWLFIYPNGDTSGELHLVIDRPVKLIMESEDILHSLFVSAFRQKMDVVPGRYTYLYLQPTKRGVFRLSCTEYCGDNHSEMVTWVHVHISEEERREQTKWDPLAKKPWETGERLYNIHCSGCHNIDGRRNVGPPLNDIWGKEETVFNAAGQRTTIVVDENYVRESIYDPDVWIVEGFESPSKMQSFRGRLSDEDIRYLIAFLKYMKDPGKYDIGHESSDGADAGGADSAAGGNGASATDEGGDASVDSGDTDQTDQTDQTGDQNQNTNEADHSDESVNDGLRLQP